MNQEKEINPKEGYLPFMESYHTIQGEGFHAGKAAYFIRLAGCDVGCPWCDVKESWDKEAHDQIRLESIIESAKESKSKIAVITGGEPLMYDLNNLTGLLRENGFKTHLETSGAYPVSGTWDWFCLSPKKFKTPISETFLKADELKIIVYSDHDFTWAEEMAANVNRACKLFLQPEWSKSKKMLPKIVDFVKCNPHWEISLQVHKFMDIP